MMYHRKAMGTMRYSRWRGAHGAISHFYNRTAMVEEINGSGGKIGSSSSPSAWPVTLVDRQMLAYVHHTRERHYQLFRSYQQKTNSTQCKLHEGEMLRRRWHRRLQKSFITFMQFKTMKVLEEQAQWIHRHGQASVNAALGGDALEKVEGRPLPSPRIEGYQSSPSIISAEGLPSNPSGAPAGMATGSTDLMQKRTKEEEMRSQRKYAVLRRKVQALPSMSVIAPKHVATMKQIHNDRFNYRWRVN